MKKAGLLVIFFILFISVGMNIRMYFLWEQSRNEIYETISTKYFKEQEVLSKLNSEEYADAVDILEKEAEKYGAIVAAICMERGCKHYDLLQKNIP